MHGPIDAVRKPLWRADIDGLQQDAVISPAQAAILLALARAAPEMVGAVDLGARALPHLEASKVTSSIGVQVLRIRRALADKSVRFRVAGYRGSGCGYRMLPADGCYTPRGRIPDAAAGALLRIRWTRTERRIIAALVSAGNQRISCRALTDEVYSHDPDGGPLNAENVMRVFVANIRRKLERLAPGVRLACRNGHGYRLEVA